ncbi:MAG TPA: hypothetical protein DEA56_02410 [Eubacterium sp.]|nr:hypothetical protein [Eubacterium sp.]
MMSGSKAPDFDTYGLFRATHSHNPPQGISPTYERVHVGLDLLTLVSLNFYIFIPKYITDRIIERIGSGG